MPMHKTLRFLLVYFALGSVIAPITMRWLDYCHIRPIVEDCIMIFVMAMVMAVSCAVAMHKR